MNPRVRRVAQKGVAIALYLLGVLALVWAFVPLPLPALPGFPPLPNIPMPDLTWWPVVLGVSPSAHYFARIVLAVAFGLTIFLPQVETTFVSMLRRRSPMGAPYVDRRDFACPNCGTVNRPHVQFCVRCGTPVSGGTRLWGAMAGQGGGPVLSAIKFLLLVGAFLAMFLGVFDLTFYLLLIENLGSASEVAFVATLLAALPSLASYLALKEGVFRKFGSLKQFDRLVYGRSVWLLFGVVFLVLAAKNFFGPPASIFGIILISWMQLALGVIMILHPFLRKKISSDATLNYP
jgi:hypothetical protein